MRDDRTDKVKRAAELEAAGINRKVIAERLGLSASSLRDYLKRAKRDAAKE